MQVREREITYEVTVSEELRSLLRARTFKDDHPLAQGGAPDKSPVSAPPAAPAPVFSEVKLRCDGQRPLRLLAGEVLRFNATTFTDAGAALPGPDSESTVTLYLTREGDCVAHVTSKPPEGSALRPVYASRHVRSGQDVADMLRRVKALTAGSAPTAQECAASSGNRPVTSAHAATVSQLIQRLEPYLENSRN